MASSFSGFGIWLGEASVRIQKLTARGIRTKGLEHAAQAKNPPCAVARVHHDMEPLQRPVAVSDSLFNQAAQTGGVLLL